MFLINAESLLLEYFIGDSVPPYAILSHRWGDEEVDHQTFKNANRGSHLKGYNKIAASCAQSLKKGIKYLWCDTCCIDKTSSAELTESINSMFQWYEKAVVCFAFLNDVTPDPWDPLKTSIVDSEWMKRGWTLQELLAPQRVEFYALDWTYIGTRHHLAPELTVATAIANDYLIDRVTFKSRRELLLGASIGERMSWAARRQTTRREDEAYCLLGLFGVNIPLIYGEGEKAFIRLQEEILRHSFDPTLLAWGILSDDQRPMLPENAPDPSPLIAVGKYIFGTQQPWSQSWHDYAKANGDSTGFLAPSPQNFLHCDRLIARHSPELNWVLDAQGLKISLPASIWLEHKTQPYLALPCFPQEHPSLLLAIPIIATGEGTFRRGVQRSLLVSAHKWHQWPRVDVILTMRNAIVDNLRCDVMIRSIPAGFTATDLPDIVDSLQWDGLLKANQAWAVYDQHGSRTVRLHFSLRAQDGSRLHASVVRGPYAARPVSTSLPRLVNMFLVFCRAASTRTYTKATIGNYRSQVEPKRLFAEISALGPDITRTWRGGFVSIEVTESDIAGQPFLIIDIRHGPSRLRHILKNLRHDPYQDGNIRINFSSALKMVPAAIRRAAVSAYDIMRLLWIVQVAWGWLTNIGLLEAPSGSAQFSWPILLMAVSIALEAGRIVRIQLRLAVWIVAYACAGLSLWQLIGADESRRNYMNAMRNTVTDEISRLGYNALVIFGFFYGFFPVVCILEPRAAVSVRHNRFPLSFTSTALLMYWAPEFCTSELVWWVCAMFTFKSVVMEGLSARFK